MIHIIIPRLQQIFLKTVLGCFKLCTFALYRFQSDQGKGQARVLHPPELEGDVEGGLGEGIAGGAHLVDRASGGTGARDAGEPGVGDVGELGGVTDHLEVAALLLLRHGELVPDVHPVAVLAVDALATNLNLNLGNDLLTNEAEPTGVNAGTTSGAHSLVNLGENKLKVRAVAQIAVAADCACYAAAEVGLARERLLNRLHGEVGVAAVRHLPESNFGRSREEHILSTVSDQLHKSTTHLFLYIYYH